MRLPVDGADERQFTSRLTGDTTTVRVRRKVVDCQVPGDVCPATRTPSFQAEPGVRLIPVNDLVTLTEPPGGYTVIGGGKTAMDACIWLLDGGVPPEMIRWIRPRDAWLLDRAYQQPLDLVAWLIDGCRSMSRLRPKPRTPATCSAGWKTAGSSAGSTWLSSPRCTDAPP
ncbi:MAG: hypothetical protein ACLQFR_27315 [Streptosporangiaceae bacterium]